MSVLCVDYYRQLQYCYPLLFWQIICIIKPNEAPGSQGQENIKMYLLFYNAILPHISIQFTLEQKCLLNRGVFLSSERSQPNTDFKVVLSIIESNSLKFFSRIRMTCFYWADCRTLSYLAGIVDTLDCKFLLTRHITVWKAIPIT